jgi:phage gp29-like protein
MFRLWTVKDWHRAGEFSWKPYRIGYYKKDGTVDEDRTAVEEALQYLSTNGFAALPDTVKLEIEFAKNRTAGDGGVHGGLASFLAGEMSKVTLGATLSVEQGRVGSQALGNVHQDVGVGVRDADARALEDTIQRQLIAPLVRYNFGDVPIPAFRFTTEEGADLAALANALHMLGPSTQGMGLHIPAKWVRTTFGIPEPEIGDELMDGSLRRDLAEVAAEAAQAKKDMAEQMAPKTPSDALQEPAKPGKKAPPADEPGNDNGPPVSEKAIERAYRTYVTDRILTMAGFRKRNYGAFERAA